MPKTRQKELKVEDLEDRPADDKVFQALQNFGRDWRILGRELGVKEETLTIIEHDYRPGGMREMTYQMLLAWQKEKASKATIKALAEHLENCFEKAWAEKILTTFLLPKKNASNGQVEDTTKQLNKVRASTEAKRLLREKLEMQLKERYKNLVLKGLPWMNQVKIPLADYYVELNVLQQIETGMNEPLKNIKFEDIFSAVKRVRKAQGERILVEGAPGNGKTTFASKLCYDFAQNQPYMQQFNLVFFLPLRHFTGDWREILGRSAGVAENERDTLLAILNTKKRSFLLILDGYDEISDEHQKIVLPIIRGTLFPRLTVIVTSRSGMFSGNAKNENCVHDIADPIHWNKTLKLAGFDEGKQEQFIETHIKYFSKAKKDEVMEQLTQMKKTKMMDSSFLACPLFLLIIILLLTHRENAELHFQTKTDLYKRICNFIIRRYATKQGYHPVAEIDLFTNVNSDYVKLMIQFSEFSLNALNTGRLSFSEDDFKQVDEKSALQITKMGFLVTTVVEDAFWEEVFYEPVHKSLMEFAAAYRLWKMASDRSNANEWQAQVALVRPQRTSAESLIFPFLAGLMGEEPGTLFQALREHEDEYLHNFDLLWSTLFEMHMTPSVLSSLSPFLPVEWNLTWYNASSQKCKVILHHGINTGKIKQMRWNIAHTVCLPDDVQIDKLIIETFQLMPPLPAIQFSNFSCTELCFHLNFTDYKTTDDWHNLLSHLSSIPCEKLSFTFYDSVPFFLPMIHSAVTGGRFSNSHFHRIECHVEEKGSLVDLMKLVEVTQAEILNVTLATSNSSSSSNNHCEYQDCQAQWQQYTDEIFTCITKESHLTNIILKNKTSYYITIRWEGQWHSNKRWEMVWFEGIKVLSYSEDLKEFNDKWLLPRYQNKASDKETACSVFITTESVQECERLLCKFSAVQPETISLFLIFSCPFHLQLHLICTLTKLIQMEIVSTLEICLAHAPLSEMTNYQKQLDAIVECSIKSSQLTRFVFKDALGHSFTIDFDKLCDNKLWNTLWLEGVKIQCTRDVRQMLDLQEPTVLCQYKGMDSLDPWCYFLATDETLEEWLILLSHIYSAQHQDVSFVFFGFPYFLPFTFGYLTQIHKIECHLREKQCHAVDPILKLLSCAKLEILELQLYSPPSPRTSRSILCNNECSDVGCDWMSQKQIDMLIISAAKSQHLIQLVLKNKTEFCYTINMEDLCHTDQKLWKMVLLEGITVKAMDTGTNERIEIVERILDEDIHSSNDLFEKPLKSIRFRSVQSNTNALNLHQESISVIKNSISADNKWLNDTHPASVDLKIICGSNQITNDESELLSPNQESLLTSSSSTCSKNKQLDNHHATSADEQVTSSFNRVTTDAKSPTLNQESCPLESLQMNAQYATEDVNYGSNVVNTDVESSSPNQESSSLEGVQLDDQHAASVDEQTNLGSNQINTDGESSSPNQESSSLEGVQLNDQHATSVDEQTNLGSNQINTDGESSSPNQESSSLEGVQLNDQHAASVDEQTNLGSNQINTDGESSSPNQESSYLEGVQLNDQHAASVDEQTNLGSNQINPDGESSSTNQESYSSANVQLIDEHAASVEQQSNYSSIQVTYDEGEGNQHESREPGTRSLTRSPARNSAHPPIRSESVTSNTPLLPKESSHETGCSCCNCCCVS